MCHVDHEQGCGVWSQEKGLQNLSATPPGNQNPPSLKAHLVLLREAAFPHPFSLRLSRGQDPKGQRMLSDLDPGSRVVGQDMLSPDPGSEQTLDPRTSLVVVSPIIVAVCTL